MERNTVYEGNCVELASQLDNESVRLVACSPPYAMQRKGLYGGVTEAEYPSWTVKWMAALRPKLKEDGSILIVIREHLKGGELSDYVLRTRLAVREAGWRESETLIWYKPDAPPLGSIERPRRTWEYILWYSKSKRPFVSLKACGNAGSVRTGGFAGSDRFGEGGDSPVHGGQKWNTFQPGTSRCTDVVTVPIGSMDKGVPHPAMYPKGVPEFLIQTFSETGDLVVDPFAGSGQTLLVARNLGREYVGFELSPDYVALIKQRFASESLDSGKCAR